ncbi:MAG: ABC transporter permease [Clostridium sp.]
MRFTETLQIVFINIMQNKIKVLLTSLGIIVGAATIVMVIAIGKGGEDEIKSQFSGLSAETIYVNPDYSRGMNFDIAKLPKVTIENMEQIMDEGTSISKIYLRGESNKEVTLNSKKDYIPIVGVTDNYSEVSNLNIIAGDNITDIDIEDETSVVVIGDGVAKKYFNGAEDAVGNGIRIDNRTYSIIGVLERTGEGLQGLNPDDSIFMPFTTADKYVFDEYVIPQVVALASNLKLINTAMDEIRSTLDYVLEDSSGYILEDTGSRIEAAGKSAKTMNMLLISVATIVFIVGGIGIMNVLFVSVKERTKEIGILKALGSSSGDIMWQFLLESIIISIFGGAVGVGVSYAITPLMKYTEIPMTPSISGKVIALAFAIITGTVFGLYPAYKASKLKPIEALNYE